MSNATTVRTSSPRSFSTIDLPVKAATKLLGGTIVGTDASGWAVGPALATRVWGTAARTADNTVTGAAPIVNVRLPFSIEVQLFPNDTGSPLTKADVGRQAFVLDNQTLTGDPTGGLAGPFVYEVTTEGVWAFFMPSTSEASENITLADEAGIFTATNVEAALAEVKALADAGMPLQKRTVTVAFGDFSAAATTQTFSIGATLPANARVQGVNLRGVTAFSGSTISAMKLDIGSSGDVDALVAQADLFATVVDGQAASMPAGIAPHKDFVTVGAQLQAKFTATGANVNAATAGSVIIEVLFTVLA